MTSPEPAPTPPELDVAPECASLCIVEHALYVAMFALVAANPRVTDCDLTRGLDKVEVLAEAIIKSADALQTMLRRYREAATQQQSTDGIGDDNLF